MREILLILLLTTIASAFHAVPSFTAFRGTALGASSFEEDLMLTRQIIMDHVAKHFKDKQSFGNEDEGDGEDDDGEDDYPANDLMIRAALGQEVERTPLWLFRQAGRHLPEYQEYKEKVGRSFLDMLSYPEDVAECTMQPLRRYEVDAAILFSDILVIAEALGIEVTMPGGVGIQIPDPIQYPSDLRNKIPAHLFDLFSEKEEEEEEEAPEPSGVVQQFVQDKLSYVTESVRLIRKKMKQEKKSIPLIGFSAAPYTLLFYMVGGSSKKNTNVGMTWLKDHPGESQQLLRLLTSIVTEYMAAQVEAGAHLLQLFEAMGMMIDETNFYQYAMPCLKEISSELKKRYPAVPIMVFTRGACFSIEELSKLDYDVITIDGSVDRVSARRLVGPNKTLQGNYDPAELIPTEDDAHTPETVRATARAMLEELGPQRLIANLGEGLGGKESPELVEAFVNAIHEESEDIIAASKQEESEDTIDESKQEEKEDVTVASKQDEGNDA